MPLRIIRPNKAKQIKKHVRNIAKLRFSIMKRNMKYNLLHIYHSENWYLGCLYNNVTCFNGKHMQFLQGAYLIYFLSAQYFTALSTKFTSDKQLLANLKYI